MLTFITGAAVAAMFFLPLWFIAGRVRAGFTMAMLALNLAAVATTFLLDAVVGWTLWVANLVAAIVTAVRRPRSALGV